MMQLQIQLQDLAEWLNGNKDYDRGLMLYHRYFNQGTTYKAMVKYRDDKKLFALLREGFYELRERASATPIAKPSNITTPSASPAPITNDTLKGIDDRAYMAYKEMQQHHAVLKRTVDTYERWMLADKIMKVHEKWVTAKNEATYFELNGALPSRAKVKKKAVHRKATVTSLKRYLTIKTYLCRYPKVIAETKVQAETATGNFKEELLRKLDKQIKAEANYKEEYNQLKKLHE